MKKHAPKLELPQGKPGGAKWADDPAHCIIVSAKQIRDSLSSSQQHCLQMDGHKAPQMLDFKYRSMYTTVVDMYEDLQIRKTKFGWASTSALADLPEKEANTRSGRGCLGGILSWFWSSGPVRLEGPDQTLSEKGHWTEV